MKCNVQVIEAADIPNQEEDGLYVRLNAISADSQKETDVVTNNPPHWDSEFTFQFQSKEDANIEITLLSGDKLGIDKEIGNSTLSLSEFEKDTDTDKWIELKSDDGSDAGRIHLIINVTEHKVEDLDDILNLLDNELEVDVPEFDKAGLENKEFQSKLTDEPNKKVSDEISDFNLGDLVDGNDSASDDDLLLKAGVATFTVIDLKNADQIPQIASNIGSAELYCVLSTSESSKSVKTNVITDPSTSSWNQEFKFHVNDVSSAKFNANLYSANKDTENEELATGTFSIGEITVKKNITVDLHSTQDPSLLAQLEISIEYSSTDEIFEEDSNIINSLSNLLDDSQKIEDQNENDIKESTLDSVLEQTQPETHDEINETDQKVELEDNKIETNDANEHQDQIEPQNDQQEEVDQNQIELLNDNEHQEDVNQNLNDLHNDDEQQEEVDQNQIELHNDNEQQEEVDQNQIELHNENEQQEEVDQNQIETHDENEQEEQIATLDEIEQQHPIDTHDENEQQEENEPQIEEHNEEEQQIQIEVQNEEEEQQSPVEIINEEDLRDQIETHNVIEKQIEDQIETNDDQQNQIETLIEHEKEQPEQIETYEEIEPHNEEEEHVYQAIDDKINSQAEEEELKDDQHNEEEDIFDDYEEDFYEGQASNSQKLPTKDEKFERSINKLLMEKHSDQEEAEKEKEQIYNYVKSEALEMYQRYVITPVERKEDTSRTIVLKLTKNNEELEKLHERMSKPENMSPMKLKREIKKLEKEIQDLTDDINSISNENDELENIIFMMKQQINNKATNE